MRAPPPAVAAIDVGSNATRLSLAQVSTTGVRDWHDFVRYPVRLGADAFAGGTLMPARVDALAAAFADIAQRLRAREVRTYRAVATAALRAATNGPEVVARLAAETGLHVEIIPGRREARLARAALLRAVGSVPPDTWLLDLGGGSLEVASSGGGRSRSLPLGTLRLLARHPELAAPIGPEALAATADAVDRRVRRCLRGLPAAAAGVGAGGNLEALARLCPAAGLTPAAIDLSALGALAARAAPLSPAARAATFGLRPDRADLLLPAALVVRALAAAGGLSTLWVPGTGLRDALLYELTAPADAGQAARRLLPSGHDQAPQAARAAALARQLFEALAAAHGLWPQALHPLLTATYAFYVGAGLRAQEAVRHATYVVEQVDGLGLDARSRPVAAHAVRSLAPGPAPPFAGGAADAHAAAALAGLLRLALALAPLAREATPLSVSAGAGPLVVCAGLRAPLPEAATAPLAAALGRDIAVR